MGGLSFYRDDDGTITGRNLDTGFTVIDTDEEEVKRRLYENAGWDYTPPPPPVPPGFHRFALVHDEFGGAGFDDERYARLRENPPSGCEPDDWGCFALECERPGATLLAAVTDTVAEIRREYGLVMSSLGIEKPEEWYGEGKDGFKGRVVAHLLLMAAHRAALIGYSRDELVALLDAASTGTREDAEAAEGAEAEEDTEAEA
ncbi:hypothetical protein [Streptomyces sp. NBC_00286]|uniref:hypothetical protein n=1 Tax=Streptomyces sp. NBC_00286 TaxID=2975701 RepID=UPI002E2DDFF3|nr:hypothetical protein [Streptomyces sp. NBC_00286]